MGLLESLGAPEGFMSGFSGKGLLFWGAFIFFIFFLLIVAGAIAFFYYSRKSKKISFKNQVPIFMSINGKHTRIGMDWAKELFVPDSNISLFFLKTHKIYLARPTRAMGKNEYWYSIAENGEWVNFDLSMDPEENTLAKANYDHRDTRYAYVNLKEIIKRNYKDKAVVWWKDPVIMNIISFMIMAIIFVGAIWFVFAKAGGLLDKLGILIEKMGPISDRFAEACTTTQNINSGVIQA